MGLFRPLTSSPDGLSPNAMSVRASNMPAWRRSLHSDLGEFRPTLVLSGIFPSLLLIDRGGRARGIAAVREARRACVAGNQRERSRVQIAVRQRRSGLRCSIPSEEFRAPAMEQIDRHAARLRTFVCCSAWTSGNKRRRLATGSIAIEAIVVADNRFGATFANHEWFATVPAGLGTSIREIRCHFFHVRAPSG